MSNETRHYFGAYLEIETAPVETSEIRWQCANEHPNLHNASFCPKCGTQVANRLVTTMKRPTAVYELLGNDEGEQLATITPPPMYNKKIIAIANTTQAGHWLITDDDSETVVKDFPTDTEVNDLKAALETTYADIIATLRQHPAVLSVEVRAGYVLDTEY